MSAPDATNKVRGVLKALAMPVDEILFVHVRLKELSGDEPYRRLARRILEELNDLYRPRTILVPAFTYGFTKTGRYDRRETPGEVGRFGEEVRKMHSYKLRTMNPVFSVVDTLGYFTFSRIDETTAFGPDSLLDTLASRNYVIVNINLSDLISTHLHYLEYVHGVNYRFDKVFSGAVSPDGRHFKEIDYRYFVRDHDLDTRWRRDKLKRFLTEEKVLKTSDYGGVHCNWMFSDDLDQKLGAILEGDPRFLITD